MNQHASSETLYRWTFTLVDEIPGPSVGDAAEHLEALGFNPWSFANIEILTETTHDEIVSTEFAVTGSEFSLNALRTSHAQNTGSNSNPLQQVSAEIHDRE